MRIAVIVLLGFVAGCGESEDSRQSRQLAMDKMYAEAAKEDARKAAANSGYDKITYPSCPKLWAIGKLTSCGRAVYKIAISECKSRAVTLTGSNAVLDEYVGDSWQDRAGLSAGSIEERLARVQRDGEKNSYLDTVAVAVGNGSNDIAKIMCKLDAGMHLEKVSGM